MKTLLNFILLISLFSCQDTTNRTDTTTSDTVNPLSESNFEEILTVSTSKKPPATFNEIPLLAAYINELPFYDHEFP
jgi:hypothetical protein